MKFCSLKNKNRRVCSAVHRAVSIWKLNSLPVNRLKPKIKVVAAYEHYLGRSTKNFMYISIMVTITEAVGSVKTRTTLKKSDRLSTTQNKGCEGISEKISLHPYSPIPLAN